MGHIHTDIDWCVGAYIVYNNKVLIRLHDKAKRWFHVGGHVELHEDPITAIKRECREEVGLDITLHGEATLQQLTDAIENRELVTPAHMNIHRVNPTHQHIDLIYYATSDTDNVVPEQITDEWMWLTRAELLAFPDVTDKVRHYALGALDTLRS